MAASMASMAETPKDVLTMGGTPRASRAGIFSWMLFDWAAQPYFTLLITFVFSPYFVASVASDPVTGQAQWGFATGFAGVVIALSAPVLGALADRSGPRKPFIAVFSVLAIAGAVPLFLAAPGQTDLIPLVLISFAIGLIGVEFATVFTNAMMPDLVPRSELGRLSGSGWALGYVGGLLSLVLMLGLLVGDPGTGRTLLGLPSLLPFDPALHPGERAAGPFTALWYLVFVLPLFAFTPDARRHRRGRPAIREGLAQLLQTLKGLPARRSYFSFLISSMLYRDGLNALYAFGGIYAAGVLGLSIIQIGVFGILAATTGAIGAFFGGRLDDRFGPRLVVHTGIWLLILACATIISTTAESWLFGQPLPFAGLPLIVFYIAGALIGAAGGALQAASRTLLVDQVNHDETTEAFGLYALSGKATAFIGPIAIGIATALTGSQQLGITPIIGLLVLGAVGLLWVRQGPAQSPAVR